MKILMISLKRLGDVILTTPAVRRLAKSIPGAEIDFLVYPEFAAVLENNPYLREVLIYPKSAPWRLPSLLRSRRYDWAVDFLTNGASSWAAFFSGAPKRLAFRNSHPAFVHNMQIAVPETPMYSALQKVFLADALIRHEGGTPEEEEENWKPEIFIPKQKRASGPTVMISPASRRASRAWREEGFAEVARRLAQDGVRVICLWGPGEKSTAESVMRGAGDAKVELAPGFSNLRDLAHYVSAADMVLTNCNGTRHVATAVGVPTLTVHLSSDPVAWNPPAPENPAAQSSMAAWAPHPRHPIVRHEKLFCIGCRKNECPYRMECSSQLSADAVYYHASKLLESIR